MGTVEASLHRLVDEFARRGRLLAQGPDGALKDASLSLDHGRMVGRHSDPCRTSAARKKVPARLRPPWRTLVEALARQSSKLYLPRLGRFAERSDLAQSYGVPELSFFSAWSRARRAVYWYTAFRTSLVNSIPISTSSCPTCSKT